MLAAALAMIFAQPAPCLVRPAPPTAENQAVGKIWYTAGEPLKLFGKTYKKYGLPRVLKPGEVKPLANYQKVIVAIEAAPGADAEILYILTNYAACEFQPYVAEK